MTNADRAGGVVAYLYHDSTGEILSRKQWHPAVVAPAGVTETPLVPQSLLIEAQAAIDEARASIKTACFHLRRDDHIHEFHGPRVTNAMIADLEKAVAAIDKARGVA